MVAGQNALRREASEESRDRSAWRRQAFESSHPDYGGYQSVVRQLYRPPNSSPVVEKLRFIDSSNEPSRASDRLSETVESSARRNRIRQSADAASAAAILGCHARWGGHVVGCGRRPKGAVMSTVYREAVHERESALDQGALARRPRRRAPVRIGSVASKRPRSRGPRAASLAAA